MILNDLVIMAKERNAMVLLVPSGDGVDLVIRDNGGTSVQVVHKLVYKNPLLTKDGMSVLLGVTVKRLFRDLEARRVNLV